MASFTMTRRGFGALSLGAVASPWLAWPAIAQIHDPQARLRYALSYDVVSFDPHRSGSSRDQEYLFPVYDRLVHQRPDGGIAPALATSWEFTDEGLALVFALRSGVSFGDGTPFDAEVVRANIERGKTLEGSTVRGDLAGIERVEVLDPLTVKFHLTEPNFLMTSLLAARAGSMVNPGRFDDPDLGANPDGLGPFRMTSYVRGSRASFERNPDYWNPEAVKLGFLEIHFMPDNTTRLNALIGDELELAVIAPADVARAQAAGLNVDLAPSEEYMYFLYNMGRPPLDNLDIRKAIHHGIDRAALVAAVEFGLGAPLGQWALPGSAEYDPDLEPFTAYDPDLARALVAGSGIERPRLELIAFQGNDQNIRLNQAVQAMLAEVGFDVEVRPVDRAQAPNMLFNTQQTHGIPAGIGGYPQLLQMLHYTVYREGRVNIAKTPIPAIDDAVEAGLRSTTPQEALVHVRAANRAAVENYHLLPFYLSILPMAMSPRVSGYVKQNQGRTDLQGIAIAAS